MVSAVVSDYSVGKTLLELGGKAAAYAVAYDKASFSSAAHRELLWFMVKLDMDRACQNYTWANIDYDSADKIVGNQTAARDAEES